MSFLPSLPPPTQPNTSFVLCTGSRWQPYSKAEYIQTHAMENRVASKLAFLFKWDGGDFWKSELISHSFNPLFIQPGICFPTYSSTVQPVERGWVGSHSLEGPSSRRALRFYAKLLVSLGQLCLLLIKSCHSHEKNLGVLCVGGRLLKNCLLARLIVTRCIP